MGPGLPPTLGTARLPLFGFRPPPLVLPVSPSGVRFLVAAAPSVRLMEGPVSTLPRPGGRHDQGPRESLGPVCGVGGPAGAFPDLPCGRSRRAPSPSEASEEGCHRLTPGDGLSGGPLSLCLSVSL